MKHTSEITFVSFEEPVFFFLHEGGDEEFGTLNKCDLTMI